MASWDSTTNTKIAALRAAQLAGTQIHVYELLKIEWPSPDGSKYYGAIDVAEVASASPGVAVLVRIVPESKPDWFLPIATDSTIGDEEIDVDMWDGDGVISTLLVTHGEGVKAIVYYWFPQQTLLLPDWQGHIRFEDEASADILPLKIAQGFRSSDAVVPGRQHYPGCSSPFGGLFTTQAEIDEIDCTYNKQIGGGTVGNNNPATGLPWTYCDRRGTESCTARAVPVLIHLSHKTAQAVVVNNQTSGGNLFAMSQGNETNLKEPVTVIMGTRRKYGMKVLAYLRAENNNNPDEGFFHAIYEGPEGPISQFASARVKVGGKTVNVVPQHYNYRLGTKGQTAVSALTTHGYSGTSLILYVFGPINPAEVGPEDAEADAVITGLSNIRVYTTESAYSSVSSNNRVWQIMEILCDKRWGYGLDYTRFAILDSWIPASTWAAQAVTFTDTFGAAWIHVRSQSDVELVGKKIQQQIEDMCMAGRLSRPFLFNGKICIEPLKKLSAGELAAAPVFTDEGSTGRNVVWEGEGSDRKSSLKISRKSDLDLVNRVECVFDDIANGYLERPLQPIEDIDAQYRAGRVVGDKARKINSKQYRLLGVVNESQAIKLAWSLLDLGPHDDGGLENNLKIKFTTWYLNALDLHQEKVIKFTSARLTKYGFTYFRVKKLKRLADLQVEVEAQAYNETYMSTFEADYASPPPTVCSIDSDCGPLQVCINGVCVDVPDPPPCQLIFGTVTSQDGFMNIPIDPCL